DFRLHDLRRTARTLMSRLGVPEDIAELAIGHVRADLVARYNKDEAWEGRGDAFTRGSDHVAALLGARARAAVIPLPGWRRRQSDRRSIMIPIAIALLLLAVPANAQDVRFHDAQGRVTGSARTDANGVTTFHDRAGRVTGTARTDRNGVTTFHDASGRVTGSIRRWRPMAEPEPSIGA